MYDLGLWDAIRLSTHPATGDTREGLGSPTSHHSRNLCPASLSNR